MTFHSFEIEKFLSTFEKTVEYNYTESGVQPVTLRELLELADGNLDDLLDTALDYPQVNGDQILRERIAAFYPGAGPNNVLVTVGASEANLLIATTMLQPGDEIVTIRPTYLQFAGIARNIGVNVKTVDLVENNGWSIDLNALSETVTEHTRFIAIVNPNNPTGYILTETEMDTIITIADRVNAWILADEVYTGAEREQENETPSFYGRYDKVIAINSLSKAYGLPGLRCGWAVGPEDKIQDLWRRHEYAVISASMLSNKLAAMALSGHIRPKLIARTRKLIQRGFDILKTHLAVHDGVFTVVPPQASAISFIRYNLPINSTEFARRLQAEKSVLVVPGDCFNMDNHLRITSAYPEDYLKGGYQRINEFVEKLL